MTSPEAKDMDMSNVGGLTTGSLSAADVDAEPVLLLLVEDNADDIFLTRRAFRAAAPHVTLETISHGQEAIEKAGTGGYDVAVVDYQLPDLSGIEVLHRLVALDMPVIIVT